MKKYLLTGVAAAFVSASASAATTYTTVSHPWYAGIDYSYSRFGTGSGNPSNFNGVAPSIGYRFHPNFALEFGYNGTEGNSSGNGLYKSRLRFDEASVDLVGNFPLVQQLELLGLVGYTHIWTQQDLSGVGTPSRIDHNSDAFDLGGGLQYNMTQNVALRVKEKYLWIEDSALDHQWQTTAGLVFKL